LGLGGYQNSLKNASDARSERQERDMKAQEWQLKLKALQDAQAQAERLGGVYSGMPTNAPVTGVSPRTAAQFWPTGGDSTGMTPMPPAPVTQASPYDELLGKAAYFQAQAAKFPKDAKLLIAEADKYIAQAKDWRDQNEGDIQFVRVGDKMVGVQRKKYGKPEEMPGYQPKPQWSMQDRGGSIEPVDLSGVTTPPVMQKTMTFADRNAAGNLALSRERLAFDKTKEAANPPSKLSTADNKALEDARAVAEQANEIADKGLQFKGVNATQATGGWLDRATWLPTMDKEKQLMESFTAKIAPQMRIPGSGTTSDRDLAFFVAASPSIEKSRQVNDAIVTGFDLSRRNANDRVQFLEAYAQNKGSLLGAEQMWRQYLNDNPIFDQESTPLKPALNESRKTWQEYFSGAPRKPKSEPTLAPGKLPTLEDLEAEARRRGLTAGGNARTD
jgi:hypothetical protein